jgi:hypothetical protein
MKRKLMLAALALVMTSGATNVFAETIVMGVRPRPLMARPF